MVNGGGYLDNRGFAVSGILYPILILTLFLIVQILAMMASRKAVLDKNKQQLLDSVNAANKIYTNEELSILLAEAQETIKGQADKISLLEKTVAENKKASDSAIASIESYMAKNHQRTFQVGKLITSANATSSKIIVNLGASSGAYMISVRLVAQYAYVNYGGYAQYDLGTFTSAGQCYGLGDNLVKKGNLGSCLGSISTSCSKNSDGSSVITMSPQFTGTHANGSEVYAIITVYTGYANVSNISVSFE